MTLTQEQLARNLRAARERAGLTQRQAAAVLGCSRRGIYAAETAERRVSTWDLTRLSDAYSVSLQDLLNPTGLPPLPAVTACTEEDIREDREATTP